MKKLLRDLIAKHERGEPLRLSNDTLGAFLDEWLKSKPKLKESSREHYEKTLNYYVRPELGKLMLKKVEASDVDELYAEMAPEDIERFLTAANSTRFGCLLTLAFHTGCRPGELLGLRWSDLGARRTTCAANGI